MLSQLALGSKISWPTIAKIEKSTLFCFVSGAKPELVDHTSKKIKPIGSTALLLCTFDTPVNITWLKDDVPLRFQQRIYVSRLKPFLQEAVVVERIEASDRASYTCVGRNTDGDSKGSIELDVILSEF